MLKFYGGYQIKNEKYQIIGKEIFFNLKEKFINSAMNEQINPASNEIKIVLKAICINFLSKKDKWLVSKFIIDTTKNPQGNFFDITHENLVLIF